MTNDITTPHNNLFEKAWGNIELARGFFNTFFYKEHRELFARLDLSSLTVGTFKIYI